MHIYFSGIGGVALGPLAELAVQAGYEVSGSDLAPGLMTDQLKKLGIKPIIGQSGKEIASVHTVSRIDWVVMTAALPPDHPEIAFARDNKIKITKRDELINFIVKHNKLQLIAISGTHGKTTTTAMLAWLFKQFNMPVSYSIGTTLSFGPSGKLDKKAEYFIYEADEFDRNMLKFHPALSLITSLDYDHPDVYPTVYDYKQAFRDFIRQSNHTYIWQKDADYLELPPSPDVIIADKTLCGIQEVTLAGEHNRQNARLVMALFAQLFPEFKVENIAAAASRFPGTSRRFEELADNLYTDYAHHPAEIAAMIQLAREVSKKVVVVYQPHQNVRQHGIKDDYKDCFDGAEHVFWLPTYLSREEPGLEILRPDDLIKRLTNPKIAEPAKLDDNLLKKIAQARKKGELVLAMGAGDIDGWLRKNLRKMQ